MSMHKYVLKKPSADRIFLASHTLTLTHRLKHHCEVQKCCIVTGLAKQLTLTACRIRQIAKQDIRLRSFLAHVYAFRFHSQNCIMI